MTGSFECPRRIERYPLAVMGMNHDKLADYAEQAVAGREVLDEDGKPIPLQDEWNGDTCSYCDSISPEALFKAIEDGAMIVPTDKSYKVYVGGSGGRKFYMLHLNREGSARLKALLDAGKVTIGEPGYFYNGLWLA